MSLPSGLSTVQFQDHVRQQVAMHTTALAGVQAIDSLRNQRNRLTAQLRVIKCLQALAFMHLNELSGFSDEYMGPAYGDEFPLSPVTDVAEL